MILSRIFFSNSPSNFRVFSKPILLLITAGFLTLTGATKLIAEPITVNCDIPGGDIKNLKSKSAEACQISCDQLETCKAFSFISGWNRCFLKKKIGRKVSLKIHSGEVVTVGGKKSMDQTGPGVDIPGKDLRKIPATKSADECSAKCLAEPKCVAFSYLDGYRDCWLKDRSGKRQKKVFSCGIKNTPPKK